MNRPDKRSLDLSPRKRALVELLLRQEGLHTPAPEISRRGADRAPLSFAQHRLWFLDQLVPGNPAYNIPLALHLSGPVNVSTLERAVSEVVRRHEILRTTFAMGDEAPLQIVASARPVTLPVVDLAGVPAAERPREAERLANEEAQRPFDMAAGPLFRLILLNLGPEEHVLVLTMHHAISEAWSLTILLRELGTLYQAFARGEASPLPDPAIQYADFAWWQRDWVQGELLESQLSYWKRRLGGSLPVVELPTDRPRLSVQTFRGAVQKLALPPSLSEAVRALSQREGATVFMSLVAAFKALLCRYTQQEDVLVGFPISNRNRTELEGLIGFFVNTLVLRTDLTGDPTFREILERVREAALGAYSHQDVPFEMLVRELRPERDMSHTPLVQIMFVLQNAPVPALHIPGVSVRPLELERNRAKYDITMEVIDNRGDWEVILEYNTDLFNADTITRLLGHYRNLLKGATANPNRRLSMLPLLSEAETRQLLLEWNATRADLRRDQCVHQLVEAQAAQAPEALAVADAKSNLTYGELNRRANQLAHVLRSRGVGPEVLVAVCMERSVEMVVGLLGILKAGGGYLPLDPAYPAERLAFMLADARAPVVLTQERLRGSLPADRAEVFCLDSSSWEAAAGETEGNPPSEVRPDNLAYVIYTSGSTGTPKGVEIPHLGLLNLVAWHREAYHVTSVDRATQLASPAFDASVWEIWPYLVSGASIHIPDQETRAAPTRLLEWLAAQGITLSFLPTPLAEAVLAEPCPARLALRALLTGGDMLHTAPPTSLPFGFFNHYGPTEFSVVSTWTRVLPGSHDETPPIGRPIANTQVYVLDRHGQPVPVGVPGELYVGGLGLARGYLHRPGLTAEKFVPNSFAGARGARLYRTGDLAKYRPDGRVEFLGRTDHQVKIRGFRMELGEIETSLGQHPNIREAVVMARDDDSGGKRLVAYVVAREKPVPSASELRSFLKERLPDTMVPSSFVLMESLPLTPNGKVDRRNLPVPDNLRPDLESPYVPPHSSLERAIAGIWSKVLGPDKVGVDDNFFDLGGHSLLLIQVHGELQRFLDKRISMVELFQYPTIRSLSRHFAQEKQGTSSFERSRARANRQKEAFKGAAEARRKRRRM